MTPKTETARGAFQLPIDAPRATARAVGRAQSGDFVAKAKAYGKDNGAKSDAEAFGGFARTQEGAALYAEFRKQVIGRSRH